MVKKNPPQLYPGRDGGLRRYFFVIFGGGQSRLFFLFGIEWAQRREGDRMAKILRINRKKQMSADRVFFDNRVPGQVRDRLTEGWPEGRAERERTSQN